MLHMTFHYVRFVMLKNLHGKKDNNISVHNYISIHRIQMYAKTMEIGRNDDNLSTGLVLC